VHSRSVGRVIARLVINERTLPDLSLALGRFEEAVHRKDACFIETGSVVMAHLTNSAWPADNYHLRLLGVDDMRPW
jgi:hypothetical protein